MTAGVVLVGPPGADLDAVADALAVLLGLPARHLDAWVERAAGRPVADLVIDGATDELRAHQAVAAAQVLAGGAAVIAVGEGAVEVAEVRAALRAWARDGGAVILVDLPVYAAAQRAGLGVAGVPALGPVRATWRAMFERRHALLEQVSTGSVTGEPGPEAVAESVVALLARTDSEPD